MTGQSGTGVAASNAEGEPNRWLFSQQYNSANVGLNTDPLVQILAEMILSIARYELTSARGPAS
jgi:hypothetical protein